MNNTWLSAEKVTTLRGVAICIYKYWGADYNDFAYCVKTVHEYNTNKNLVLDNKLRCVLILPIDAKSLVEEYTAAFALAAKIEREALAAQIDLLETLGSDDL
jgi:hypothetical protein